MKTKLILLSVIIILSGVFAKAVDLDFKGEATDASLAKLQLEASKLQRDVKEHDRRIMELQARLVGLMDILKFQHSKIVEFDKKLESKK